MTQENPAPPSSPKSGWAGSLALAALLVAALAWYRAAKKPPPDPSAGLRDRVEQMEKRIEDVSAALDASEEKRAADLASENARMEKRLEEVLAIRKEEEAERARAAAEEKAKAPTVVLPDAARKAVEALVPGIEIVRVRSREQEGLAMFEVEGRAGGESVSVRLTPGGQIDSLSGPAALAPKNVRDAASAAAAGVEFRRVNRRTREGETLYELKGQAGKDAYEVEVRETGEVRQIEMPISKTPKAAQDAAAKAAPGVKFRNNVEWEVSNDGEAYYDYRGKTGERDVRIRVTEDGRVLRRDGLEPPEGGPPDRPPGPPPGPPPGAPPGPPPGEI